MPCDPSISVTSVFVAGGVVILGITGWTLLMLRMIRNAADKAEQSAPQNGGGRG
jgi:hypothetical protein